MRRSHRAFGLLLWVVLPLLAFAQTQVTLPCPSPGAAYHSDSFGRSDSTWFMNACKAVAMPDQGMVVMSQEQGMNGKGLRLTRTDALGNPVWSYTYLAAPSADELPTAIVRTAGGDLLVTGTVPNYTNVWDPFLMKIDANGDLLWYKTYSCGRSIFITDLAEGANGTIALVGMDNYVWTAGWIGNSIWNVGVDPAHNAAIAMVTDASGSVLSATPYAFDYNGGGRVWEWFTDVEALSGGGFLITGNPGHNWDGIFCQLVLRVDDTGNMLWVRTLGFNQWSTNGWHSATGCTVTQDSPTTAIACGNVSDHIQYGTNWSYRDLCVTKVDLATGNVLWGWRYPIHAIRPYAARMVAGALVVVGDMVNAENITQAGACLLRIDPATGNIIEGRQYGYAPPVVRGLMLRSIDVFSSGDLALAGYTDRDARAEPWYLHTDGHGDATCEGGPLELQPPQAINWSDLGMAVNDPAVEGAAWSDSFQATAVARTLTRTCQCIHPAEWCPAPSTASFTVVHDVLCPSGQLQLTAQLPTLAECGSPAYSYGWSIYSNGTIAGDQVVGGIGHGTYTGAVPPTVPVPFGATSMQVQLEVLDCAGNHLCAAVGQATVVQPTATFDLGPDTTVCTASYAIGPASPLTGHSYYWYRAGLSDTWSTAQASAPVASSVPYVATASGSYFLVDSIGGCTVMDSVRITLQPMQVDVLQNVQACTGDTVRLDATWTPASTYQWGPPLTGTSPVVVVTASGTYRVTITENGCSGVDSAVVDVRPVPVLGLPATLTLCLDGGPALFTLPVAVDSVRWNTGSLSPALLVDTVGVYVAQAWIAGCASELDSMQVERVDCSCQLYLPNSFTPDGDGVNDLWGPEIACDLEDLTLMVFDRWGELLQTLTGQDLRWDGRYGGGPCPEGVYPYKLRYTVRRPDATVERAEERFGHVTLVR